MERRVRSFCDIGNHLLSSHKLILLHDGVFLEGYLMIGGDR